VPGPGVTAGGGGSSAGTGAAAGSAQAIIEVNRTIDRAADKTVALRLTTVGSKLNFTFLNIRILLIPLTDFIYDLTVL